MFLMYVDECGDSGRSDGSSRYFILSGLVVHECSWRAFMDKVVDNRHEVFTKYGMNLSLELHAKDMLGRSKREYTSISKTKRIMVFRETLKFEGTLTDLIRIINVVVDKKGKEFEYNVFEKAWNALINRFETTIRCGNFPIISDDDRSAYPEHGMIIVDETDEKKLRNLIRTMRRNNLIPSKYNYEQYKRNISCVIEDAMHKQSQYSIPIQLCDANAYFLRQALDPNSTVQKYDAQNYFYFLKPVLLKEASKRNPYGIVEL